MSISIIRGAWLILAFWLGTPVSLLAADPATLAAMKRVAASRLPSDYESVFAVSDGAADLYSCGQGALALGLSDRDDLFELADFAAWSVLLVKKLSVLGLSSLGSPYINQIEQLVIVHRSDYLKQREQILRNLARSLNTELRRNSFTVEGGCGAGEVSFRIAVNPAGSRLQIIKEFYYLVCQARNQPPDDMNQCFGWHDSGGQESGSGRFRYQATLPNGSRATGIFEVNDPNSDVIRLNLVR